MGEFWYYTKMKNFFLQHTMIRILRNKKFNNLQIMIYWLNNYLENHTKDYLKT